MGICFGPADHQAEHDEYELKDLESTQEQDSTPFADEEDDRAADSSVEWSERTADKWDFDSDPDWR